jgi:transcriptional regulator with XRE-family HTH domain
MGKGKAGGEEDPVKFMTKWNLMLLSFGDAVRIRRYRTGLTQAMFARKARLHRSYVCDIELGRRNPTLKIIVQLARALGVSPVALLKDLR